MSLPFSLPFVRDLTLSLPLQAQSVELVKLGAPPTLPILTEKLWKRYEDRRAGTPKPRHRDLTQDKSKGMIYISGGLVENVVPPVTWINGP